MDFRIHLQLLFLSFYLKLAQSSYDEYIGDKIQIDTVVSPPYGVKSAHKDHVDVGNNISSLFSLVYHCIVVTSNAECACMGYI